VAYARETEFVVCSSVPLMPEFLVVWSSIDQSDVRSGKARRTGAICRVGRKYCGVEPVGKRMQRDYVRDDHIERALYSAGSDSFPADRNGDSDVDYRRYAGKRNRDHRHACEHIR